MIIEESRSVPSSQKNPFTTEGTVGAGERPSNRHWPIRANLELSIESHASFVTLS